MRESLLCKWKDLFDFTSKVLVPRMDMEEGRCPRLWVGGLPGPV